MTQGLNRLIEALAVHVCVLCIRREKASSVIQRSRYQSDEVVVETQTEQKRAIAVTVPGMHKTLRHLVREHPQYASYNRPQARWAATNIKPNRY